MSAKTPLRVVFDGSNNATGLAEFQSGEFIALSAGGLGASLSIGSAGQVLKVNSGASALEFGNVEAVFNIDGMTDGTSITLADGDVFAISDGGTEKRITASQIKAYVSGAGGTAITALDLDGATDIGAALADADLFIVDDGAGGTNRKMAASRIKTYVADITLTTAAQTNITSLGTLTSLTVDDITIDGSTISDSADITIDAGGDINLDAGGADINFKDDGTKFGHIKNNSSNLDIKSEIQDKDIVFKGNDGGSTITALTLDMSEAGAATFNGVVTANAGLKADNITIDGTEIDLSSGSLTIDAASNITLDADSGVIEFKDDGTKFGHIKNNSSDLDIKSEIQDKDIVFKGNDGGSVITALTLDMSNAGAATFNNNVTVGGDLIVNGTTTTVNSTTVTVDDPIFTLGGDSAPGSDDNKDRGIEFRYHTGSAAKVGFFGYDDSASAFTFIADATNSSEVFSGSAGDVVFGSITGTTLNTNEIVSSGITINDSGNINLDADGGSIFIKDNGTVIIKVGNDGSSNAQFKSNVSDKDILFKGNDGPSEITALTLDMSEAGAATFNDKVILGANKTIEFGDSGETISGNGTDLTIASSGFININASSDVKLNAAGNDIRLYSSATEFLRLTHSSGDAIINSLVSDKDIKFQGNDGGSGITALTLDMSEAGAATFNSTVESTGNFVTGAPTLGNDEASFGFNAPNAELKAKNSSGSPAANFDIHTTNSSGTTARVLRATHDGILQLMSGDTVVGKLSNSSSDFVIESDVQDKDIIFKGDDGGSGITALTLDMSEAGAAAFNSTITADGGKDVILGKNQGTNFTNSLLIGHATTGTLDAAENNTAVGIGALDALTSGDSNVAIGYNAGTAITSGGFNVLMGRQAGEAITTTFSTVAIGDQSFKTANTNNNTGLGTSAGLHTTGGDNTAIGRSAGQGTAGQSSYTNAALLGYEAGKALTTGSHNILLGSKAGDNITTGSGNVLIGSGIDADAVDSARTLKIAGYDGSSTTTWISGDSAGALTFADKVVLAANKTIEFGDSGETISGDGTNLSIVSSNSLGIDTANGITLDSGSGGAILKAGGSTTYGTLTSSSGDLSINQTTSDKDIIFTGNDGGSTITPMMIDMSAGGHIGIGTADASYDALNTLTINTASDLPVYIHSTDAGNSMVMSDTAGSVKFGTASGGFTLSVGGDAGGGTKPSSTSHFANGASEKFAVSSAGVVTISGAYSLPTADGSADQVLTTDGSGTLSFADAGGASSGFSESTITTLPGQEGNFDLAKTNNTGSAETGLTAGGTDSFGVALGSVYTMMEPVGASTTNNTDLGSSESHVGA